MSKESNVFEFYLMCNKLKDIVRTGWKDWGVDRFRVESIAEHVYGTCMLAIAMWSEYKYNIDIKKVLSMLVVHEMEEIIIGDLTCFQIEKREKQEKGHKAVEEIFSKLTNGEQIKDLIFEFDERKSQEAKFAYFCDKLECDLQSKIYDMENCVDLTDQKNNKTMNDKGVQDLLKTCASWSEMWMSFGQQRYGYDENFMSVSEFVKNQK